MFPVQCIIDTNERLEKYTRNKQKERKVKQKQTFKKRKSEEQKIKRRVKRNEEKFLFYFHL